MRAGTGDITQPAVKLEPSEMKADCYYKDLELEEMVFRIADMSYYTGRGDNLVEDITQECL